MQPAEAKQDGSERTGIAPNFIVIGAAKCATSSLCNLIGAHPDAFMCDPKEPFFFSRDSNYLGQGWSWYESLFAEGTGKKVVGEGSVHYSQRDIYPNAAPRIAKDLPHARLIYIVRHPLQQIESHWLMLRSFWHSLRQDNVSVLPDFNRSVRESTVLLETARYWKQISWYREHFADEQILVLFFEDFKRNPDAVLARCFEFLGIEPTVTIAASTVPKNISKALHDDRWFLRPFRLMPGSRRLRDLFPAGLRDRLRPLLRRPAGDRPEWDDATRRAALEELAEPSRTFLAHYGKPADFWSFP